MFGHRRAASRWTRGVGAGLAGAFVLTSLNPVAGAVAAEPDDAAAHPTFLGSTLYTGEFHSHTSVSDGVQLPPDAFGHVHEETDADFFTVSEHDVMWDIRNGDDFITDPAQADSTEWRRVHEQAEEFNAAQDDLVAIPSIENTWYDGTGHINTFNAPWHVTARATSKGSVDGFTNSFGTGDMKYDLYTYFARLKQDQDAIGQFNHPSPTSKGNFFGFNGLTEQVDASMGLIEVKSAGQASQYQDALDKGWHLGPVYSGDEHSATWVSGNPAITGVWATDKSPEGLYAAMRNRSTYSTLDVNAQLGFGANGRLMGSILPGDTPEIDVEVWLKDPDTAAADRFTSVTLITNDGAVAHDFGDPGSNDVTFDVTIPADDGDFFYVRAEQADGNHVISAPVWVGDRVRGANYAPTITVPDTVPATASYGDTIELPAATATDDSGTKPTVAYEVFDSRGEVPVVDGAFEIRSYDDAFVVVKATDDQGNVSAELVRVTVAQDELDPAGVFQHFGSTAVVAQQPGGAGLAVSTDRRIATVYAQVREAGAGSWSDAEVLTSVDDEAYEVDAVGNDEPEYQHSITGQTLRGHEFDVTGLVEGMSYEYRFGVAVEGQAPAADDAGAWTGIKGELVAGGAADEPLYWLGDLQASSHDAADVGLLRDVLDRLRTEAPGGTTLVQTGDLVDNGGRGQYWDEAADHVFDGLDLQYAPVVGNHETYGDLDYDSFTEDRAKIFSNMFATPDNGVVGESNYSFDRGDVHVAVLNSNIDLDRQLTWLKDDIRSSTSRWNVVTGHFSYYGGRHADDASVAADRSEVTKVLADLGVDLYLGGHDHVYKRSTIYDGRLAATEREEVLGTTYVTLGSAGPKFYDNTAHWWDDVVFDEDTQVGTVMTADDDGLELTTYTLDGRVVDSHTVRKPTGEWALGSVEVDPRTRTVDGVGVRSFEGSRDSLAVAVGTYDADQERLRDLRVTQVELDHRGREQYVELDTPLPVDPSDTVKAFVWDSLAGGMPLRPAVTVREGIAGSGTAEDPYLLETADDLPKIANDPAGHYRLEADLDLSGVAMDQLGRGADFEGTLDGAGHTIRGYTAPADQGTGLFAANHGTIRNLAVEGDVTNDKTTAGLLADLNHGIIENVRTAGRITARQRVGGIVGDSYGVVRNSYSSADVRAAALYSGGVVAIAMGGSVTENVFATGHVSADTRNAGGVVGYGYDETAVHHVVSINASVTSPSFTHGVVGRVGDGQVADLQDNWTSAATPVSAPYLTEPGSPTNWKGGVAPVSEVRTRAFYEARGWDFATVWDWSATGLRPVLRAVPEEVASVPAPDLPTDERGFHVIDSPDDLAELREFGAYDYVLGADLDLSEVAYETPTVPLLGELDGAGHTITGLTSSTGGLLGTVGGYVHDLAVVDASVTKDGQGAGILAAGLADDGVVERVYVTGSVTARTYAGGLVGSSFGTIRDVYSTAAVATTTGNYAGGLIGVDDSRSLLENSYATGTVASGGTTAGGLTGYCRDSTCEVRDSFALNPSVTASSIAHRVVARAAGGQTATLANNYAVESMTWGVQSVPATGPATLNGETKSVAAAQDVTTWDEGLGWDFESVWRWDENLRRPVLRGVSPSAPGTEGAGTVRATAPMSAPRTVQVVDADGVAISHEVIAADGPAVTLALRAGAAAAGQQLSVLVQDRGSDLERPTAESVVYLNEVTLDEAGNAEISIVLPDGDASGYDLAANSEGAEARYSSGFEPPLRTSVPVITSDDGKGRIRPGAWLSVEVGHWYPAPDLSYQWLADGAPIDGATGERFHLIGRWKGHEITVEVTGTLDGYRTATVGSEAVRTS
ncbi:hypothetical protein GCM10027063_22610 [Promicromonospora xylanilytica]